MIDTVYEHKMIQFKNSKPRENEIDYWFVEIKLKYISVYGEHLLYENTVDKTCITAIKSVAEVAKHLIRCGN